MEIAQVMLFFAIVILIAAMLHKRGTFRFLYLVSKIRGPSLWELATVHAKKFMGEMMKHFCELCDFYSYEPWGFWTLTGDYVVVLSNVDTVSVMYTSKNLVTKPDIFYGDMATYMGEGSLVIRDVAKWRVHRKVVSPAFHKSVLELNLDIISSGAENIVQALRNEVDGPSFDASHIIDNQFTDTTVRFLTSNTVVLPDVSRFTNAISESLSLMHLKALNPIQHWLFQRFHKPTKRKEHHVRTVISEARAIIEEKIDEKSHENDRTYETEPRDVLECGLRNFFNTSVEFGRKEIFEECLTVAAAAVETTKTATKAAILLLALHQDVQEKVVEELDGIFTSRYDRPTPNDIDRMDYLMKVIKETLRLFPAAPNVARRALEETDLNGTLIPKGACTLVNILSLHRNPNNFSDPMKFDPERFSADLKDDRHPFSYIPFGFGKRGCVGKAQALLMMKVILSTIFRRYKVLPGEGVNGVEDIHVKCSLTLDLPKCAIKLVSRD